MIYHAHGSYWAALMVIGENDDILECMRSRK